MVCLHILVALKSVVGLAPFPHSQAYRFSLTEEADLPEHYLAVDFLERVHQPRIYLFIRMDSFSKIGLQGKEQSYYQISLRKFAYYISCLGES